MELSKLFLYGIGAFIVVSLWLGSQSNATKDTENSNTTETPLLRFAPALTVADTPATVIEHITPYTGITQERVPTERALAPTQTANIHQNVIDDDEYRYETYATYEYIRPRNNGNSNTYSFRLNGKSEDGVRVTGSVNTRGQYGEGILVTEDGERLWITTTWSDDGDLIGRDGNGTEYFLNTQEIR